MNAERHVRVRPNPLCLIALLMALLVSQQSLVGYYRQSTCALSVTTTTARLALGLPLVLDVKCTNITAVDISGVFLIGPDNGQFTVHVETDLDDAKEYVGPGWGLSDAFVEPITLRPGQSVADTVTVLWNYRQPHDDEALQRPFAFELPGTYRVVGRLHTAMGILDAPPITIEVSAPAGDDEEVWQRIRSNPNIAKAMQTLDPEDAVAVVVEVEQILKVFPNSIYRHHLEAVIAVANVSIG